jgi:hypothetical protein
MGVASPTSSYAGGVDDDDDDDDDDDGDDDHGELPIDDTEISCLPTQTHSM